MEVPFLYAMVWFVACSALVLFSMIVRKIPLALVALLASLSMIVAILTHPYPNGGLTFLAVTAQISTAWMAYNAAVAIHAFNKIRD
jgi:hypothetical protein